METERWTPHLGDLDSFDDAWDDSEFVETEDSLSIPSELASSVRSLTPLDRTASFPVVAPLPSWGPSATRQTHGITQPARKAVRRYQSTSNLAMPSTVALPSGENNQHPAKVVSQPSLPKLVPFAQMMSRNREVTKLANRLTQLNSTVEQLSSNLFRISSQVDALSKRHHRLVSDYEVLVSKSNERFEKQTAAIENMQNWFADLPKEQQNPNDAFMQ